MTRRILDLTYCIHEGMTTFPVHWHPAVEITHLGRHGIENRETRKLTGGLTQMITELRNGHSTNAE